MANFEFDDSKSFEDNLDAFITEMEDVDSKMAAILKANITKLFAMTVNGPPDRKARAAFNEAVLAELEQILANPEAS
jgi:hypothetical protein